MTKKILYSSLPSNQCFDKICSAIVTKFNGEVKKISDKSLIFKKGSMKSSKNLGDYPLKGIITMEEKEKSKILINFNYIFFIKNTFFWLFMIISYIIFVILGYFLFLPHITIFFSVIIAGSLFEIIMLIILKYNNNKAELFFIKELNL